MKKIYIVILLFYSQFTIPNSCTAQVGEWVWLHGDTTTNGTGTFGTQGVPAPTNVPPAFYEACEWTDLNNNLWLFGGIGNGGEYGDLWKYDPAIDQWTWMKGNGVANDPGNYGTIGISSPANLPPSRGWGATTWIDQAGDLWLYGGYHGGTFSDLWKYTISTNEWTWVKGPNTVNQPGVFGIQGIPDPANFPESRAECGSAWTDNNNNLWLFGGYPGYRNDMWRYSIAANEWTWMKGSQATGAPAVYGTFGVEDPLNIPGERESYSHWTDASGNFYLFAGRSSVQSFNEFWKYNTVTNNWAWIGGTNTAYPPGVYGSKCVFDSTNMPGERCENRAVCKDQFGNFWLFGGGSQGTINTNLNDLWVFCLARNQWVWVGGDTIANPPSHFGTAGVSSPLNNPPGKAGANMWCDNNGHIYVFGGNAAAGYSNDFWKFTIDYTCVQCSTMPVATFSAPNHICPGTCTDFTNLSSNSTSYLWTFAGATPGTSTDINPTNICYNTPGTYAVTLVATNASGSDTLTLNNYITVYPAPPPQGISQSGDTLSAIAGATSYQWYFNGNVINGATEYFYVAQASGDYNVVATDGNGCEVEAAIFNVFASLNTIGKQDILIFPNPAEDKLIIQKSVPIAIGIKRETAVEISIYNMVGEKVMSFQQEIKYNKPDIVIDVASLRAGMYMLEISDGAQTFRTKFAKAANE